MASMHIKSNNFQGRRKNSLSISGWDELIKNCNETIPTSTLNKIEPNILEACRSHNDESVCWFNNNDGIGKWNIKSWSHSAFNGGNRINRT